MVVVAVLAGVNALDATIVGVFYDDAQYVILAKSLATGNGFRFLNLPDAPAGTHFPPGYPALLALLWRASPSFPENIALFRIVNALLLGAVAFWTFHVCRVLFQQSVGTAALTALAGTITIPPLVLSSNVLSETLFLALLLPLLLLAERHAAAPGLRRAALLGLAAAALTLIRSHGIVLLPTLAILYALRHRWREAATSVTAGLSGLLPWFLWVARHDGQLPSPIRGQYGSYSAWFLDGLKTDGLPLLFGTVTQNIRVIYNVLARSFSVAQNDIADSLGVIALSILLVAGAIELARRWKAAFFFTVFYVALVLVWPFSPLRFIWGIWPLIMLMAVAGARYLWNARPGEASPNRALRLVGAAAGVLVFVGAAVFNVRGYANAWWATVGRSIGPRIQPHLIWTAQHTDSADIIAAADDGAIYLYTGRKAVPVSAFTAGQYLEDRTPAENAADLAAILRGLSPTHVIAWAVPTQHAAGLLAQGSAPLLVRTDTIPGGVVLRPVSTTPTTGRR